MLGAEAEQELASHIVLMESRGFGLTKLEVRQLAYEYAKMNNIKNNFDKKLQAAENDWLTLFLKRHREIALRPQKDSRWHGRWG